MSEPTRVLAFHLPQFHPTAENDLWWGKGFTEWTNVVKARPQFPGHYQPHLPADLGFYDLRLSQARQAQSELAGAYGIDGFLYYHYWFGGRRLLNEPVDRMLATDEPGLPFALCWANEPWSRRWDGSANEVLMAQTYDDDDDLAHIRHLSEIFCSDRYIRIDGRPLLAVYDTAALPDPRRTADAWRAEAHRLGVGDLFLCSVERYDPIQPASIGFDAAIEFQPHAAFSTGRWQLPDRQRVLNRLRPANHPRRTLELRSYEQLVQRACAQGLNDYLRFPGVSPGWDNTARRAVWPSIYVGNTPELYERWLLSALQRPLHQAVDGTQTERLVFVNAWNEWAEGNHLEPDARNGRAYLEATLRAVQRNRSL